MTGKEYLQCVRKHIWYVFDRDGIEQELAQHLEDSMETLQEEGYSKEEAEGLAVELMGSPDEVGKQLNKEHHPVLGYAWLLSVLLLICLAVPAVFSVGHAVFMGAKILTPMKMEQSAAVYPVDIQVELPTHKLSLDNLCVDEEGEYYLTYRARVNYSYSRAGWSAELFTVHGSDGKYLQGGGFRSHSAVGLYGYVKFHWPEDGLLQVRIRDGQMVELNLNEVMGDETK